jgi:NAD(P)-dependent dehydrogenase (short-subunit alcohol dehydrogenase family)
MVFLILGQAASGIGKEAAFSFAESGAKGVVFADIRGDEAAKAAEECKGLAVSTDFISIGLSVDVTDVKSVQSLVELALKEFGRIDYLVNAAGASVRELTNFHLESNDETID